MKVAILGAGIIGVTTAWYLQKQGFEVVVIDRQAGPAQETSFANGAQISVCFCEPWANKSAPLKILKWLFHADSPILLKPQLDKYQWKWCWEFFKNCNDKSFNQNVQKLVKLGLYSQKCLHELTQETNLQYEQRNSGILHFFTCAENLEYGLKMTELMQSLGVSRKMISAREVLNLEPALKAYATHIVGGTYTPTDEVGNTHIFAQELTKLCEQKGAVFLYNKDIKGLISKNDKIEAVELQDLSNNKLLHLNNKNNNDKNYNKLDTNLISSQEKEIIEADIFVVAMGAFSVDVLRPLGINLDLYPTKGYSATLKIKDLSQAPRVSLTDDHKKMVFSLLGDKLRVAGTAEISNYDQGFQSPLAKKRCHALVKRTQELFPDLCDLDEPEFFACLRPSTPNNVPYICQAKVNTQAKAISNLFINTGHGTLGWTHACGSGKIMAQLIAKEELEINESFS